MLFTKWFRHTIGVFSTFDEWNKSVICSALLINFVVSSSHSISNRIQMISYDELLEMKSLSFSSVFFLLLQNMLAGTLHATNVFYFLYPNKIQQLRRMATSIMIAFSYLGSDRRKTYLSTSILGNLWKKQNTWECETIPSSSNAANYQEDKIGDRNVNVWHSINKKSCRLAFDRIAQHISNIPLYLITLQIQLFSFVMCCHFTIFLPYDSELAFAFLWQWANDYDIWLCLSIMCVSWH